MPDPTWQDKLKSALTALGLYGPMGLLTEAVKQNPKQISKDVEGLPSLAVNQAGMMDVAGVKGPMEAALEGASKARVWYSSLEKLVRDKLPNIVPQQQARAVVSAGKVAESGPALDWLNQFPANQKVSKEELLGKVREGVPEFKDVMLGEPKIIGHDMQGNPVEEWTPHGTATKFSQYVEPGGSNYKEMFVTAPKPDTRSYEQWAREELTPEYAASQNAREQNINRKLYEQRGVTWRDGHDSYSDIENPIVRLRFNDRIDSNNQKVLFLEEIQPPLESEQSKMPPSLRKNWKEIGLSRAIKYAADNGYDRIAWTTGEMQTTRYPGIEQVADELMLRKNPHTEKGYKLIARQQGLDTKSIEISDANDLARYIGKEPAKRLLSKMDDAKFADPWFNEYNGVSISGDDLKVGGVGLRDVYDVGLPSVAKKLGMKVENIDIRPATVVPLTENGETYYMLAPNAGDSPRYSMGHYATEGEARKAATDKYGTHVQSFSIPPSLRSHIQSEGMQIPALLLPVPAHLKQQPKESDKGE